MNKLITISNFGGVEIRNYENSDVPFDYYFDTIKRKDTIFLVNKHLDVEVLFITKGKLKIHLDKDVFIGDVGDIIVINPNVLHNIIAISEEVTYDCLIIDKNYLEKNVFSLEKKQIKEKIKDEYLFGLIRTIKDIIINRPPVYQTKAIIELLRLNVGLLENYSSDKEENASPNNCLVSIEKSINYINKNFNSDITIDDVAAYIGYSKFYFCRKFKDNFGYCFQKYMEI